MYCISSDQGDGVCLVKRLLSAIGILFFLLNCIPSIGFFLRAQRVFIGLLTLIGKWCDFYEFDII